MKYIGEMKKKYLKIKYMENECYFVNSRGLLKSCNFFSQNPKSSCNNDYSYLLDMLISNKMTNGMSIYVCSELLNFFVNKILPKIQNSFVLLSGDSDLCVPIEILTQKETMYLLNSSYLIKWFIQNTRIQDHEKIIQMPIGLDYHTIANNPKCNWISPGEDTMPILQEKILKDIITTSTPFYERIPKIYINFSKRNDRFKQREKSLKIIPTNLIEMNANFVPRTKNWNIMSKYTFILSPFGNGMDCHRTWEALCLGCIPIICAPNFKKLFDDLPVLIVDDWSQINEDLLNTTIINFKSKQFNYDKLTLSYWINEMK